MDGFLSWFFAFVTTMFQGVWRIFSNLFSGIIQIFNLPAYFDQIQQYKHGFGVIDWILCIISLILTFTIWIMLFFMLVLIIRKYIRFRHSLVGNEDLLEEIADLHRDVIRLTKDKERIMNLKVGQAGISIEQLNELFSEQDRAKGFQLPSESVDTAVPEAGAENLGAAGKKAEKKNTAASTDLKRFLRLSAVDEKYEFYTAPEYELNMSLAQICEDMHNYACSGMRLYYDIKTIRLMFAGLASTKLILLQGISGTGKTSLPYMMGKYFMNDSTIASVQPLLA